MQGRSHVRDYICWVICVQRQGGRTSVFVGGAHNGGGSRESMVDASKNGEKSRWSWATRDVAGNSTRGCHVIAKGLCTIQVFY